MILSPADQKRFKKLAHWVRVEAPRLANDKAVVETMNELVDVAPAKVKAALQWGRPPTILVVEELICRRGRSAGCFRQEKPDQIEIEAQIVEAYERGLDKETRSTGSHHVPKPGIILLHELVHWADYLADGERTDVGQPYHDIASKWEWLVFATFLPEMMGD